ncbi:hypothetical protein CU097_001896 [Rhizopus azygosporus]|uniref:Trehalase n=2 Tax=Rhizopus TaxID=4842 RepID=A0A367IXD3_RHIAZ|nr:hypothetical protein CU097_001896 [Rhizopus azygosporus]
MLRSLCGLLLAQLTVSVMAVHPSSHSCDSPIYCEGPILKTVQLAKLFPDSKTFVDMPTLKPESEVIKAFNAMGGTNATKNQIEQFVKENFLDAGAELNMLTNVSIKEELGWIQDIPNLKYRGWINHLNHAWTNLTFEFDYSKLCPGCSTSTLPVKRPFVVPGGRFREFYYWDSFFVIKGLLLSDQDTLARNMIENFFDFIDEYGFIPNGARIYYLNRSQPPFLSLMVNAYYEKTKDEDFMAHALPYLDKEYTFWMTNTTVEIKSPSHPQKTFTLNRYTTKNKSPRPESYVEDYNTVDGDVHYPDDVKNRMYADIAAGAESGWDFSSRWTRVKSPSPHQVANYEMLRTINTQNVVPIDLNALLWYLEDSLSKWHKQFGHGKESKKKSRYYAQQAKTRLEAMDKVMWNDDHYSFYDFNLTSNAQNIEFTPANLYPIWLGAIPNHLRTNKTKLSHTLDAAEEALRKYPGILTTSYYNTTMQWDWPNGWPPLTFIAIQSFMNVDILLDSKYTTRYGTSYSELAQVLASRYAASAFCGWYKTGGSVPGVLPKAVSTSDEGHMFEKFDVTAVGAAGGQGEYTPQVGFGWTNGVAMWIFNTFDNLTAPADCNQNITINF